MAEKNIFEPDRIFYPGKAYEIEAFGTLEKLCQKLQDSVEMAEVPAALLAFVGFENLPLLLRGQLAAPEILAHGGRYRETLPAIDPDNCGRIMECIESGTGICLVAPWHRANEVIPLTRNGYISACERAGDNAPVMATNRRYARGYDGKVVAEYRAKKAQGRGAHPEPLRANRLSEDFGLIGGNVQLYRLDGYVHAVFSDRYVPMPPYKLIFEQLVPFLDREFKGYTFSRAQASEEYIWAEFCLDDTEAAGSIGGLLMQAGYGDGDVRMKIRFSTSDIGLGAVRVQILAQSGGTSFPIGNGVRYEHLGNVSVEKYAESLEPMVALVRDADQAVERLCLLPVEDVSASILGLLKGGKSNKLKALSSYVKEEATAAGGLRGRGIDVYMAANRAAEKWRKEKKPSPSRFLELENYIAKYVLWSDFAVVEKPGED